MRIDVGIVKESVNKLSKYVGAKIHRIDFITNSLFIITTSYSREEKIIIDLNNYNPFIYLGNLNANNSIELNKFLTRFKKIFTNSYIKIISLYNNDKIIQFDIVRKNEYYEEENKTIYFELISYHPNIVLVSENNKIIDAYKLIEITNKRPVLVGMNYLPPIKNDSLSKGELTSNYEDILKEFIDKNKNAFKESIKEKRKAVFKYFSSKKKSLEKKIIKLELELEKSKNYQYYKDLADDILTNIDKINDYKYQYNDEIINLDKSKSINENINLLYKRYKKNKSAIEHINEQIEITKNETNYFTSILNTLYDLDDEEYLELLNEFKLNKSNKTKKKNNAYRLNEIEIDGYRYIYGKNALQNDILTFKIAKKSEHWFHLDKYHGHHLIIRSDKKIGEKEILTAAKIIVMFSNKYDGEVIHTLKEYCHKGKEKGQVNLSNYETINVKVNDFSLLNNSKKVYFKN